MYGHLILDRWFICTVYLSSHHNATLRLSSTTSALNSDTAVQMISISTVYVSNFITVQCVCLLRFTWKLTTMTYVQNTVPNYNLYRRFLEVHVDSAQLFEIHYGVSCSTVRRMRGEGVWDTSDLDFEKPLCPPTDNKARRTTPTLNPD